MSTYENARAANIRRNQALLAELNLQSTPQSATPSKKAPDAKRRKTFKSSVPPSRISARIAASDKPKPMYNEDDATKISLKNSNPRPSQARSLRNSSNRKIKNAEVKTEEQENANVTVLLPTLEVREIIEGWSSWKPTADPPTRDSEGVFHFADQPTFIPNKSPAEVIREGAFGGSYYRPLRTKKLGIVVEGDWEELPQDWIEGLDVEIFLNSSTYDPEINKYKVACGQSIEEWEASGWINHEFDIRGWFQWYTRFFRGRRCEDDERQISRWRKCVGETGRWRRTLLKRYMQLGVRTVWDDGEDEDAPEVSPVVHQTCHHWAWEVRQEALDAYWAGR